MMPNAGHRSASVAKGYRLKAPEAPESAILSAVLIRLQYERRVAWVERMNTGAMAVGEGKARRFVRFGFPGCSDILGQMKDGRLLAIEVKSRTGRATDAQAAFLALVRANGGVSGIARSVDDLETVLSDRS